MENEGRFVANVKAGAYVSIISEVIVAEYALEVRYVNID
jgi:hypothetical protein